MGSHVSGTADETVRAGELDQLVRRDPVGAFPEIGHQDFVIGFGGALKFSHGSVVREDPTNSL